MIIETINETSSVIVVNDLGIELQPTEKTNLLNIHEKYILESEDLASAGLTYYIDNIKRPYDEVILYIKKLNVFDHKEVDTHAHNILDDSYFDTEKTNNMTSKITYYRDVAKTQKIREEEIIRTTDGTVDRIISKIYNESGIVVETETQTLNRDGDGRVDTITTLIED